MSPQRRVSAWDAIGLLLCAYFAGGALRQSKGTAREVPGDLAAGLLACLAVAVLIEADRKRLGG